MVDNQDRVLELCLVVVAVGTIGAILAYMYGQAKGYEEGKNLMTRGFIGMAQAAARSREEDSRRGTYRRG